MYVRNVIRNVIPFTAHHRFLFRNDLDLYYPHYICSTSDWICILGISGQKLGKLKRKEPAEMLILNNK